MTDKLWSIRSNPKYTQESQREILRASGNTVEQVREKLRTALKWCGIDPDFVVIVPHEEAKLRNRQRGRYNEVPTYRR